MGINICKPHGVAGIDWTCMEDSSSQRESGVTYLIGKRRILHGLCYYDPLDPGCEGEAVPLWGFR